MSEQVLFRRGYVVQLSVLGVKMVAFLGDYPLVALLNTLNEN